MIVRYLPGLNGLRFLAASLVLCSHAYQSAVKIGLWHQIESTVILQRGRASVDFFFTLSGFLITYLLLQEIRRTGTVSVKQFYLRRVFRIWPLYFIVVFLGFGIFGWIYPRFYNKPFFDFDLLPGLLLYLLFLPNWMGAFHRVGLLLPLWSIGVEEQFYLFWAPLVKRFGNQTMLTLIIAFIVSSVGLQAFAEINASRFSEGMQSFLEHIGFHYMAIGSLFAWMLYHHGEWYLRSFFATRAAQALTIAVLLYHYIAGIPQRPAFLLDVLLGLLYGVLILSVSVVPKRLLNLEWQPLVYLGTISYGIYMYHMLSDYLVRSVSLKFGWAGRETLLGFAGYALAVATLTIVTAAFSYRYLEGPFLRLGHRKKEAAEARTPLVGQSGLRPDRAG